MAKVNAYTPFSKNGDLGRSCNEIMERLDLDEWALFLDHDVTILDNSFWLLLQDAIDKNPNAGAISCWTNHILNSGLVAPGCPDSQDLMQHIEFAKSIYEKYGKRTTDFGHKYHLSGFCFATSKRAWLKAGNFMHGFGNVDIAYGDCLKRAGMKLVRMDGAYVYHLRISNGFKDKVVSSQSIKPPAACHLNQIPDMMPSGLACNINLKISLILACRDESHNEIRNTIRSFRENGVNEVIVVDDFSKIPVPYSVGADLILRNVSSKGPGVCRNFGANSAKGDFLVWSDAHCRVRFGDLRSWASEGMNSGELLCAASTTYESNTISYGARLEWRETSDEVGFKCVGLTGNQKTDNPPCLLGSVYGCSKDTYARIGGWPPTVGFGYNEPAFTLATRLAGVKIRCFPWFVIGHQYRTSTSLRAPYPIDDTDNWANRYWVHWLLFGQDRFDSFFGRIGLPSRTAALNRAKQRMQVPSAVEWQRRYDAKRVVDLDGFLESVKCPFRREAAPAS
jgi:glycosyltransferase involved in cell wall biosynthesis